MTPEEARRAAGEHGLALRFDHETKSWLLGPSKAGGREASIAIAPQVLRDLSLGRFEGHYIKEALARADGPEASDDD